MTENEARSWSNSMFWVHRKPLLGFQRKRFALGELDSGHKTAIARCLAAHLLSREGQKCVVLVTEWGIWPSSECMPLSDRYRASLGCDAPIIDQPGHCFETADQDLLFALLSMILYFIWGCECVSTDANWAVRISHDEFLEVLTSKRGSAQDVVDQLIALSLREF